MELNSSMSIGFLVKQLAESGITDIEVIAEKLDDLKQLQNREGVWSYDRFTEHGSATAAKVITEATRVGQDCILWSLNHYLGLNRHPRVLEKVKSAVDKYGTGCGTSAVSGGMSSLHKEIERRIANMLGKEKALLYPTGYTANLGAIASLVGKKDLILFDHESHASIIDGSRLSKKDWLAFRHNDVEDLERKLVRMIPKYENIFVVVESAYSMSGDLAPLREITALKRKYKFLLYVDEAHSFGFYGPKGQGYCHEQGVIDDVDFIMSTLSKATASIGGFIATKRKFCTLMQVHANAYLFQACLSPVDAAAVLAALDEIEGTPAIRESLHEKTAYFREKLLDAGFDLGHSRSPIIPIYVPDLAKLFSFSRELYEKGVFSVAVAYPAVKLTEGRMRFIVNASHTMEQIDRTLSILKELGRKYGIIP